MANTREQYINEHDEDASSQISFSLVDQSTVERLRRDGVIEVPAKKIDIPKDMRWNEKYIASQMLQGIENGDSVDKIASSIFLEIFSREDVYNLTDKGKTDLIRRCQQSAIRNARTMTTSAENHGRLDSYRNLDAQGVVQKKVWMATPDDRTRPTHVDIDGEEQDIDKVFSNDCMFPGDGKGPAEEVWQCRCTMTDHIIGFRRADGSISRVNYTPDRTLHEEQMEEERERRQGGDEENTTPVFNAQEWLNSLSANSKQEFLDMYNNWVNGLSAEEKDAIYTYTTGAFRNINGYLRGYKDVNFYPREIENATAALEKASLPRDVIVRRGSDKDSLAGLLGGEKIPYSRDMTQEWLDGLAGRVVVDKGFFSTTPIIGGGFTDEINYIVQIPEGAHAMYIDPLSEFKGREFELLVNREATFIIEKAEKTNSGLQIFMRLLL